MEQTLIDYLTNATWQIPLLAGERGFSFASANLDPAPSTVSGWSCWLSRSGCRSVEFVATSPPRPKRPAHIAAYTRTQSAEGKRCRRRPSSPSLSLPILNYRKSSLPFGGPRCGCLQQPQIGSSASISQYCCSASTEYWRRGVVRAS